MTDAHRSTDERVEAVTRHGTVRGRPDLVERWVSVCAESEAAEAKWVRDLRSIGIKLAHPDDGHVRRDESKICDFLEPCYPQFDDGPQVGDKIALGWHDRYRVRIVRSITHTRLFRHIRYEVLK